MIYYVQTCRTNKRKTMLKKIFVLCIVLKIAAVCVFADTTIEIFKGEKIIDNGGKQARVTFKGLWNLDKHRDIEIELENLKNKPVGLQFYFIEKNNKRPSREPNRVWRLWVEAGFRGKMLLQISDQPDDSTIVPKLIRMRTDPFGNCDRYAMPDFSKLGEMQIATVRTIHPVKIKSIVARDSSDRKNPPYYKMSATEFFPFIDKFGQFKHADWKLKIHSEEQLKQAEEEEERDLAAHSPDGWSKFGGWKNGVKLKATGHFRVEKLDGKWWLVDPEGYLFWSHGIVRVHPSAGVTTLDGRDEFFEWLPKKSSPEAIFYTTEDAILGKLSRERGIKRNFDFTAANLYRKYGEQWREKFADKAHRRLKSYGVNTLANSSAQYIFEQRKTPYIDRIEVQGEYLANSGGWWYPFRDPFSAGFKKSVETELLKRKTQLNDPWCIGFFCDNEINWGKPGDLAKFAISSTENCAAKKAFAKFLEKKYGDIVALNKAWKTSYKSFDEFLKISTIPKAASKTDLLDFSEIISEEYFKVISGVFKKLAPNKLYLGCRFSGVNPSALKYADKYCDVLSYNIYADDLENFKLPKGIDKPVIIGEFHFGALDSGLFNPSLIMRPDQKSRAKSYETYVTSALKHPNFVGTHWHQYSDQAATGRFDGENFNVGFFTICDVPYPEMRDAARKVGYNMYITRLKWAYQNVN